MSDCNYHTSLQGGCFAIEKPLSVFVPFNLSSDSNESLQEFELLSCTSDGLLLGVP